MRLRRGRSGCGAGARTSGWQGYGYQSRDVRLPVTLVAVIRLDAATVLLQWSTGGMAFCWVTTRHRLVGLGYGWLLRGVYLMLAATAAVVGLRYGPIPVRDAASIATAVACGFALAVSIIRKGAGVSGG